MFSNSIWIARDGMAAKTGPKKPRITSRSAIGLGKPRLIR